MSSPSEPDPQEDSDDRMVDAIVGGWMEKTCREPWSRLTDVQRLDHLPDLLGYLLRLLFRRDDVSATRRALLKAAVAHGTQRRRFDFDEEILLREYYILRQAIWDRLAEQFGVVSAETLIGRVDAELSRATVATVRGFHRDVLEAQGRWPRAIEDLLGIEASPDLA